ncbi:cytidine deaminase [Geomonas silvestris]|uniref:Cytidine deaminase n=1 Tax=Geomonas silvestris TaxID=2740184 RepID=A0A6V8MNP6_9BACT|nr:anti-phage dCTP deaminase [Geomonas silvestris]GFO61676.1 cytidine deaminase [Geomonas silvestris]
MSDKHLHKLRDSEIFIGLVGAVGTDLELVSCILEEELRKFNYGSERVVISQLISDLPRWHAEVASFADAGDRIEKLMDLGDTIREEVNGGEALAMLSIANIQEIRYKLKEKPEVPIQRQAYIIKSCKTVEEVSFFRKVYGKSFLLISVYAPRSERLDVLAQKIADSKSSDDAEQFKSQAEDLIEKDLKTKGKKFGQDVQNTFPLGDFFLRMAEKEKMRGNLSRLLELWFGYPFHTPVKDEHAMFLANAASLRSSDLSRQVGAVIVNPEGDLLAMGCNDVPKPGGGLPWPGETQDFRDFQLGVDPSVTMKERMINEILEKLKNAGWFNAEIAKKTSTELLEDAIYSDSAVLDKARISSILEFGRVVHAEMNAITDAAKRGVELKGSSLYCTTFPCHMCARHVISSGIREVVFIEPYPKSRTEKLYKHIIKVDGGDHTPHVVNFKPFEGVSPNRYIDFFSMEGKKRKDKHGKIYEWEKSKSFPQVDMISPAYVQIETLVLNQINANLYHFGLESDIKCE